MAVKLNRLLPLVVLMLAAGSSVAAPVDKTSQMIGGWELATNKDPSAAPDVVCILRSPVTQGVQLRVANRIDPAAKLDKPTRGQGQIIVLLPAPAADKDGPVSQVTYEIPGQKKWADQTARWTGKNRLLSAFVEDKIDSLLQPVSRGKSFNVTIAAPAGQKTYSVPLAGSYAAVAAYEKCLAGVTWTKPKA
jgi:hypothetical protein